MTSNFESIIAWLMEMEGGYANHPRDPGGCTKYGITLATMRRYLKPAATCSDVRQLSLDQAEAIYRKGYWAPVKGDDLPSGVDAVVFDFGVNSGPNTAAQYLQRVLAIKADGVIGPITLAEARRQPPAWVVDRLIGERLAYLQSLKTWSIFGRGWQRRLDGLKALANELMRMEVVKRV